ncbi:MAG: hypothetical protein ACYDCL_06355 [Myxococcales bacterium]
MARARDILRAAAPWLGTIGTAVFLAFALSGGCAFVRPEHRPLAPLAGRILSTQAEVTGAGLLGKPAIINVWSPG